MKTKRLLQIYLLFTFIIGICASSAFGYGIKFEMVDLHGWGTSYDYDANTNTWTAVAGPASTGNGTLSNPYYDLVDDGLANGSYSAIAMVANTPGGDTNENGFAVGSIARIVDTDTNTELWNAATSSYELTTFMWGWSDVLLTNPSAGGGVEIYSDGLQFEIWKDTTPDFDFTVGTAGRSDLLDPTHFDTVTDDGERVLAGVGTNQYLLDGVTAFNFFENGNFLTNAYTGGASLDFISGTWLDSGFLYDNNLYPGGGDASYSFSASANRPFPGPEIADWLIFDDNTILSQAQVPEPATLMLLGFGLLGFAGLCRKKDA